MRQLLPTMRRNLGQVIGLVLVLTLSAMAIFGPRNSEARHASFAARGGAPAPINMADAQQPQGAGPKAPTGTKTWTGASTFGNEWTRNGNWSGAVSPGPGDDLVFPEGAERTFNGVNDFTINTSFNSLAFNSADYKIIGNQIFLANGMTVNVTGAGTPVFSPNIILGASQTWNSSNGFVELNGVVNLNGKTLTLTGAGSHRFDSLINGTGSLIKNGSGTAFINGDASGFGTTSLNAGNLQVGGTLGALNINGGVLQGTGTVGPLTVSASCVTCDGTIAPGNGGHTTGVLQSTGNVGLIPTETFAVDLNGPSVGTQYDRLGYGAGMSLSNANLEITLGFTPTVGQQFTIISGTGNLAGKFAQGNRVVAGGQIFTITYNSFSVVLTAQGSTLTWDGSSGDNNWATATNWDLDVAPANGLDLVFPAGPTHVTTTNNIAGLSLRSITVTGTGYGIGGQAIALTNALTVNTPTGTGLFINLDLVLAQAQIFTSSGNDVIVYNKGINLNGFALFLSGNGSHDARGVISGAGGFVKTGTGSATLSGVNTYSGVTSINNGILIVSNTNALGATGAISNTVVANGATLQLSNNVVNVPEAISLNGTGVGGNGALTTATCSTGCSLSGTITLIAATSTVNVSAGEQLTLSGDISEATVIQSLTKVGSGTLVLTGTDNHYNGTTINAGTLLVNSDNRFGGRITLASGKLAGSGRVAGITATGGTVSPGNSKGLLRVLLGDVTFNAATTFDVEISGPIQGLDNDLLDVNSAASPAVSLGGASLTGSLVNGFNPPTGTQFTIMTANSGAITGQFAQGNSVTLSGRQFSITYNPTSVVLTAGPRTLAWDGGGADNNWTTPANWVGDIAPQAGDNLVFPAGAPGDSLTNTNNFSAGTNFTSLTFTGNSYVINGNDITLTNGITENSPNGTAAKLNLKLTLIQPQTFSSFGSNGVEYNGAVNLNGFALTLGGASVHLFSGVISGAGGLTQTSTGAVVLAGANTYKGVTNVTAGALLVANTNALGATGAGNETIIANGAMLEVRTTAIPEAITLNGSGNGNGNGAGALRVSVFNQTCSVSGPITLASSTKILVDFGSSLTLDGAIGESGGARSLTTNGSGKLTLNAANTYTGGTTVEVGTLLVSGSTGNIQLSNGTLGGTGTVGNITGNGTVAPGASAGILNVNGNVTFGAATTLRIEINGATAGSQYDRLNVTGTGAVNLGNANLTGSLGAGFIPADGTTFTILQTTGTISGQFAQGSAISFGGKNFHITYNAQSVVLTAFTPNANNVQFSTSSYSAGEGAFSATITVTRTGDTSGTSTVDFATSDVGAEQRTDYTIGAGTITFAPGETNKTFDVLLVDDLYVEPSETLTLTLSNPTGGAVLGSPSVATLSITNNDSSSPTSNPLDNTDARFFVRQHFYDFLSRLPDQGGFDFWAGQITQCGTNPTCLNTKRLDVSNAFFFELEYQQTGAYVFRLYRAAFGNNQPFPSPDNSIPAEALKLPSYAVFSFDRARVVGGADLAAGQLSLANAFVQRAAFLSKYPANLNGPAFVDAVLATIKNDLGADLGSQRTALINLFNSGGRGAVMYRLADDNASNPVSNALFIDAEYNRAFVATQYFGYLRRDPDMGGFQFWLGQVNSAPLRNVDKQHSMVCSFNTSLEYQFRFSSVATHSNGECP